MKPFNDEGIVPEGLLPEIKTPAPGPRAQAIIERDQAIMSSSYTRDYPFVMDRGRGAMVWDPDGNRYLDMAAGIAVCSTGHSHPDVVAAIAGQAEKFLHMSGTDYYYDVQVRLAERLCAHAPIPDPKRIFFCNSGAESIEGAIKLARHHTGGHQMIAFFGAFHGRTLGALSLTASKNIQRKGFAPLLSGVHHVRYGESVEYIEEYVIKKTIDVENFSAIFVEPIQGEGGYIVPSAEWLQGLRDLCNRYGILMVVDEVQSGMGRTGKMFAIEHFGVEPDIICTAKGIASGLPLGAFIARAHIMNWKPGQHGTTFGGNPVACAAANATMDLLEDSLMENAAVVGARMKGKLEELTHATAFLSGARGIGLMIGIDVMDGQGAFSPETRNRIVHRFFERGILVLGCGAHTIRFCPPLCITRKQADYTVEILGEICREMEG
ncbi:MAG: acetyl ornithine aminotransferase family protein [bacterium]